MHSINTPFKPDKRFEQTVLPQGMQNSPTLCQLYVNAALQPIQTAQPSTIIYHYIDDILFAQPEPFTSQQIAFIQATLAQASLVIAHEKIQTSSPQKYLEQTITQQTIRPQKLELQLCLKTLHDSQKLLSDLQQLKPIIEIPNELLQTLRPLLKRIDPATPVSVTAEQVKALQQIVRCIEQKFVSRRILDLPIVLTVQNTPNHLLSALTQVHKKTEEHRVLEQLSPPLQAQKTISTKIEQIAALIRKRKSRIIEVTRLETPAIYLPMSKEDLDQYLVNSIDLQAALLRARAQVYTKPLIPKQLQQLEN